MKPRRLLRRVLVALGVVAALGAGSPLTVQAAPSGTACPDLLLAPGDLGSGFVPFDVVLNTRPGLSWCNREYIAPSFGRPFVEVDHPLAVFTLASIWPDAGLAGRELDQLRQEGMSDRGAVELPLPLEADRAYAAAVWSEQPFDLAEQVVLVQVGNRVGGLRVFILGRPDQLETLRPLAELLTARLKS
jgi:hypothetical protein